MANTSAKFQFSLFSILLLTTISAAILALLRPLALSPMVATGFAAYAILLVGYFILRGFFLLRRSWQLRRDVRDTRQELADWADQRRRIHREQTESDAPEPTSKKTEEGV